MNQKRVPGEWIIEKYASPVCVYLDTGICAEQDSAPAPVYYPLPVLSPDIVVAFFRIPSMAADHRVPCRVDAGLLYDDTGFACGGLPADCLYPAIPYQYPDA
jgi:hypothetical protein